MYKHLHVRIIFIVTRYYSVLVQFCCCHEHGDMFISWLKDNIHLGFVRKKFIVYIVHLCSWGIALPVGCTPAVTLVAIVDTSDLLGGSKPISSNNDSTVTSGPTYGKPAKCRGGLPAANAARNNSAHAETHSVANAGQ